MIALGGQVIFKDNRYFSLQYRGDLNGDQSDHFVNAAFGMRF